MTYRKFSCISRFLSLLNQRMLSHVGNANLQGFRLIKHSSQTKKRRKRFSPNMFGHIALSVVVFVVAVAAVTTGHEALVQRTDALPAPPHSMY
jgi:hypothetical protein